MALTLRLSTSLMSPRDTTKAHKPNDDFPATASSVRASPASRPPPACKLIRTRATSTRQDQVVGLEVMKNIDIEGGVAERLHHSVKGGGGGGTPAARVPVYVMLPLDTVAVNGGGLNRGRALNASLMALRSAGVEGVMVDVWWGIVEREGPLKYNWEAYGELLDMIKRNGLKVQMVMSFHQCGGNVGDSCSIPLPPWVLEEMSRDQDIVYTDRSGRRNPEYISLGCDMLPVLKGRTPIQVYSDYMRSFRDRFNDYFGDVIVEIQVGMGPCGELRYPSYPESNGTWRFPQCINSRAPLGTVIAAPEILHQIRQFLPSRFPPKHEPIPEGNRREDSRRRKGLKQGELFLHRDCVCKPFPPSNS